MLMKKLKQPGKRGVGRGIHFIWGIALFFCGHLHMQMPLAASTPVKLFDFTRFTGSLNLMYEMIDEKEQSNEVVFRDRSRRFLEGGITLITRGSIYHPNLLTFSVNLNIAGHRSKNTYFSDASINNDINDAYDVQLTFLKEKKINLRLFAKSQYTSYDRIFLERYFTTFKGAGIRVRSRLKFFPLELDVYRNRVKSESINYIERDEKSDHVDMKIPILKKKKSRSIFFLRSRNYSESHFNINYNSLDMNAFYDFLFGPAMRNRVYSMLSYRRMRGDYRLTFFNFTLNNLHHFKPHLYLDTTYNFGIDETFDFNNKKHHLNTILNYHLFESIVSQFHMGGRIENAGIQKVNVIRNHVFINYKKKIPGGHFYFDYSNINEWSDYTSQQPVITLNEMYEFSYTDTVILNRPGIDVQSIRVADAGQTRVYIAGIDYQVTADNNVVTISRIPGGSIPREGKIMVQYEYQAVPEFHLKLHAYNLALKFNFFKHFRLAYEKRVSTNTLTSDFLISPLESFDRDIYSAQFRSRLISGTYTLEHYDSNLSIYKTTYLTLSTSLRLFTHILLKGNLTRSRIDFENFDYFNHFDSHSLECTYNHSNKMNFNLMYRDVTYNSTGYRRGRESLVFKLQWTFRRIVLDFYYEYLFNENASGSISRGRNFFSVVLRRMF